MEIIQHDQVVSLKNKYPWATSAQNQCSVLYYGWWKILQGIQKIFMMLTSFVTEMSMDCQNE